MVSLASSSSRRIRFRALSSSAQKTFPADTALPCSRRPSCRSTGPSSAAAGRPRPAAGGRTAPYIAAGFRHARFSLPSDLFSITHCVHATPSLRRKSRKWDQVTVRPCRSGNTGRKLHHPLEFPGANFLNPYFSTLPAFQKRRKITGWDVITPSRPFRNSDPMRLCHRKPAPAGL